MMDKIWALIENNLVVNIIVGDDNFIPIIENDHDSIIEVTNLPIRPSINDSYDLVNNVFQSPQIINSNPPLDLDNLQSPNGSNPNFTPFNLSQDSGNYLIKFTGKYVCVGCMSYDALWLRETLYIICVQKLSDIDILTVTINGPAHGNFPITWADANLILNALSSLNLTGA